MEIFVPVLVEKNTLEKFRSFLMDKNLPNLYTWSLQQNKHFGGKNFKFKFVIGDIYKAKEYLVRSCWVPWFNYFLNEWLNNN